MADVGLFRVVTLVAVVNGRRRHRCLGKLAQVECELVFLAENVGSAAVQAGTTQPV